MVKNIDLAALKSFGHFIAVSWSSNQQTEQVTMRFSSYTRYHSFINAPCIEIAQPL